MPGTKEISRVTKDYQLIGKCTNSIGIQTIIRRTKETLAIKNEKLKTLEKEYNEALKREHGLGITYIKCVEISLDELKEIAQHMYNIGKDNGKFDRIYELLLREKGVIQDEEDCKEGTD